MERMLAVIFDSEHKAYDGSDALDDLDEISAIAVYDSVVVAKNDQGRITITKTHDPMPEGTMGATAVGTLIGLLGGPVGLAAGAVGGFVIGAATDFARARVGRDFVHDVEGALRPGKAALVAEINEESTDGVDARMEALGGVVFRRAQADAADTSYEQHVAALEADLAQTKAEHAASRATRRAKLQARIDSINKKLGHAIERVTTKHDATHREALAEVDEMKAENADAERDATIGRGNG
jgi:uncharacterized membrane protein